MTMPASGNSLKTPKGQGSGFHNPGIAVIGSGYWGKNLIRNFHEPGALKLICDKDETVLGHFKEQYPDVETCFALNEVLSRHDIKGVVIATPAETHHTIAREILLAGKHVFVEKPFVLDEKEAESFVLKFKMKSVPPEATASAKIP